MTPYREVENRIKTMLRAYNQIATYNINGLGTPARTHIQWLAGRRDTLEAELRRFHHKEEERRIALYNLLQPYLNAIITRHPTIQTRATRAVDLVIRDHVTPENYSIYHVTSQRRTDIRYKVDIDPDDRTRWSCWTYDPSHGGHSLAKCPDILRNAPRLRYGKRCKHMIAAWMRYRLDFTETWIPPVPQPDWDSIASDGDPKLIPHPSEILRPRPKPSPSLSELAGF